MTIGPKEQARRDMREAQAAGSRFVGKVKIAAPGQKTHPALREAAGKSRKKRKAS